MSSLYELVENLVKLEVPVVKSDPTVTALDVSPVMPEGYVWPALRGMELNAHHRVVLVEAAGAVGKTAAATAMAGTLNWPLVNAAQAQVGSYSLSGLIHDALGFESNFLSEVAGGRAGIIVDALDEAHLRAGTSNFQAFLENIRRLADSSASAVPSIVIFSRPDTAVLVRLFFEDAQQPLMSVMIEFFDYSQACQYILSYMANQERLHPTRHYGVAAKYRKAFADLRDLRMKEIASALLTTSVGDLSAHWEDVKSFLGYAPVLSVLGEYLAVSNPQSERESNIGSGRHLAARNVLLEIIANLLTRESRKFLVQVNDKLRALLPVEETWDDSNQVYGANEQSVRLVARSLDVDIIVPPPVSLPESLRQQYEGHAVQFIADHPFLAGRDAVNVVFDDYIKAKAAVDLECLTSLRPDPRSKVRSVGPFFYQFVYEFATKGNQGEPVIEEGLVSLLLSSYSQSITGVNKGSFAYLQSGDDGTLVLAGNDQNGSEDILMFDVVELSGALTLVDHAARGVVITDGGVVLSSRSETFLLGPRIQIICAELEISATTISVDPGIGGVGENLSLIDAGKITVPTGRLVVDAPIAKSLIVRGEHPWPALRRFLAKRSVGHGYVEHSRYVDLRAILRVFQQGIGHAPSVYYEKLEQSVVKNNITRKSFMDDLIRLGVLSKESNHYYLDTKRLAHYGVSLTDIYSGNPSVSVLRFIAMLTAKEW
ncbi:hypothetical protein Q5530_25465 [Saccharothrix sp. BKS2]|uniref:hypothetical protein n=1 Tax=Saccharothrix sp. BKS2 TaxID=3064400 RepID=UPI0039EB518C